MFPAVTAKTARLADIDAVSAVVKPSVVLRDRFQGALCGLVLVPMAASLHRDNRIRQCTAQMTDEIAQYFQQWFSYPHLSQPIDYHAGVWLASIPILLRYHNQPPHIRHQYISSRLAANAVITAQQWVLSDVLARALQGKLGWQGWNRWIDIEHSVKSPKDQRLDVHVHHYQGMWNAILENTEGAPIFQAALTPAEWLCHQDAIAGISSAVECGSQTSASLDSPFNGSLTYALGLSQVFQSAIAQDDLVQDGLVQDGLAGRRSLLLVGLVLGAVYGRSSLPVLWQQAASLSRRSSLGNRELMSGDQRKNCPKDYAPNLEEALALANKILSQWSGCIT